MAIKSGKKFEKVHFTQMANGDDVLIYRTNRLIIYRFTCLSPI